MSRTTYTEEKVVLYSKNELISNTKKYFLYFVVIIDVLRKLYPLPLLLNRLQLAKSSYYYQKSRHKCDKYYTVRIRIKELFMYNKNRYGYRRIHALLKREHIVISEKIVRKIMSEENLVVKVKKTTKYNSYAGEITPAANNVINRYFSADKPNYKWVADITEFAIPAGKIYLSPIVDCFDGLVASWNIGLSPNSQPVNTMLDNVIYEIIAIKVFPAK